MSKFGKDLIEGLTEARTAFARGETAGARVHVVERPDVRAIRRRLQMSQHEFADSFSEFRWQRLRIGSRGRRAPDAPAAAYLQVIARRPREILESASAWVSGNDRNSGTHVTEAGVHQARKVPRTKTLPRAAWADAGGVRGTVSNPPRHVARLGTGEGRAGPVGSGLSSGHRRRSGRRASSVARGAAPRVRM